MSKTISQLVAQVESGNVPWAMRFEPAFKPSEQAINNCIKAHKPAYMNRTTAENICKTSFGAYQIMGENIYTVCKYGESIAQFLSSKFDQHTAFTRFIEARGINFSTEEILRDVDKRNLFARRYNGSTGYGALLVAVAEGRK